MAVDIPTFAQTQLSLLEAELAAEIRDSSALVASHSPAALQRAGLALTNLTVANRRTGLGGRTVLELAPDPATSSSTRSSSSSSSSSANSTNRAADLPEHGIRVGDIVLVAEQPAASARKRELRESEARGVRGVVTRVGRGALAVALDDAASAGKGKGKADADADADVEGEFGERRVWAVKVADEVTFRR